MTPYSYKSLCYHAFLLWIHCEFNCSIAYVSICTLIMPLRMLCMSPYEENYSSYTTTVCTIYVLYHPLYMYYVLYKICVCIKVCAGCCNSYTKSPSLPDDLCIKHHARMMWLFSLLIINEYYQLFYHAITIIILSLFSITVHGKPKPQLTL